MLAISTTRRFLLQQAQPFPPPILHSRFQSYRNLESPRYKSGWTATVCAEDQDSDTLQNRSRRSTANNLDKLLIHNSRHTSNSITSGPAGNNESSHGLGHRDSTPIDNSNMIVTASRDKSIILWHLTRLRLWYLAASTTARRFVGHTKDVLSVAFSIDNRQIVSASRDRSIKLWNTLVHDS